MSVDNFVMGVLRPWSWDIDKTTKCNLVSDLDRLVSWSSCFELNLQHLVLSRGSWWQVKKSFSFVGSFRSFDWSS